jgi:hypothetical protein
MEQSERPVGVFHGTTLAFEKLGMALQNQNPDLVFLFLK